MLYHFKIYKKQINSIRYNLIEKAKILYSNYMRGAGPSLPGGGYAHNGT